jgi:uncharacterized protein
MKFLLVVLVVLIGFFIWRSNRRESISQKPPEPKLKPTPPLQEMVSCAHCGVHLPRSEAVQGRRAVYCGNDHLRLAGDETS